MDLLKEEKTTEILQLVPFFFASNQVQDKTACSLLSHHDLLLSAGAASMDIRLEGIKRFRKQLYFKKKKRILFC